MTIMFWRSHAFAKAAAVVIARTSPVLGEQPPSNMAMEGRIGPITHAGDEAVFDRIEVGVVHMTNKIFFVANRMLPEASLPERILAFLIAVRDCAGCNRAPCKKTLDPTPSTCEIGIVRWQCHDRVDVIGQDHNRIDCKRPFVSGHSKGTAQCADMVDQRASMPVCQCNREEKCSTREQIAPIPYHEAMLTQLRHCSKF